MTRDEQLDAIWAKMIAGTMTYEDTADLFMMTNVGQSTGATREEVLRRMRGFFQDETALNGYMRSLIPTLEALRRGFR